MSLEQTIRDTLVSESMDLDARLQQLVRAGLMPQNTLPLLRKSISKVQMGLSLQGPERDVMAMFINSMMYIVLGDDTIFNKARAGAKSYATEAKEKQEYDYEGDMAMSQLKSIIANSQRMHDMLGADTNLPEWVQSKITLAEDYISTAANYMQGEMNEAVGDVTVKTVSPADAWKKHTGQKTSKSKVPVDPKTGKTLYQKVTSEEVEDLEETAKIVAHLQKRYGDNIRKSHVRSAANDFGVGYVALSHAVRKKLGKKMLDEENYYTVHKAAKGWHVNQHTDNGVWHHATQTGYHDTKEKAVAWAKKHAGSRAHKIEIKEEQIDEISKKTLASYSDKAVRQTYGNQPHGKDALRKRTNREQGVKAAYNKFFGYKTKVPATEETQIDELSKDTMGRYINKAATKIGSQGVTAGLKIANDENSKKNFKDMGKREKGIATAVKKLTKESRKTEALADIAAIKQMNESYKTTFDAALETYGIKSPSELDEEKRKEFFNFVDQNYKKGDN